MNYTIVKRIKVEAPTLEEAIQNHNQGQTISLTAEETQARVTRPANNAPPAPQRPGIPLRSAPRA